MIDRINKISDKIKRLQEKRKQPDLTRKQKHHIRQEIIGKKRTLAYLCQLYIWGVK